MIKNHFGFIKNKTPHSVVKIGESEEAKICLNCPLPANKCGSKRCKRYDEEKMKLKNGGNHE